MVMESCWKLRIFKIISVVKIVRSCKNYSIHVIDIISLRDVERNAEKGILILIYLLLFKNIGKNKQNFEHQGNTVIFINKNGGKYFYLSF